MTKTEVKKKLYLIKPQATMTHIRKGIAYYFTTIDQAEESETVRFEVPINDMGDADFFVGMPAQQLNRWIVSHND